MTRLGVNIDHVATVREARKTIEPDPVQAVLESEKAGCSGIVCHLRKDRRHIGDNDLSRIKDVVTTHLNLEMSVDPEIVEIALRTLPDETTIVPEKRQEITTEGGLDVSGNYEKVRDVVSRLRDKGIDVSLFIDPEERQAEAAKKAGVDTVEFHTGRYAEAFIGGGDHEEELETLRKVCATAMGEGLRVCAGHGLTYANVGPVARIEGMYELNIGHSIISRAIFTGLYDAVKEMKELLR
ncbi:MAG: pyridoxine 5'-phosphate synthase [Candidatus Omnitrophica bacterium]|nr:pyridoxine 5'-phosphate synthase [Candidatus Omnitrophota bacterium]